MRHLSRLDGAKSREITSVKLLKEGDLGLLIERPRRR